MTTNLAPRPLGEATELAWRIGRLVNEHAMDRTAAQLQLSLLYEQSDNPGLRRLCVQIAERIQSPAQPMPQPVVDVLAR